MPKSLLRSGETAADRRERSKVTAARDQLNVQYVEIQGARAEQRQTIVVSQHGRARSAPFESQPAVLPPIGAQEVKLMVAQVQAQPTLALATQTLNMSRETAIGLLSGG